MTNVSLTATEVAPLAGATNSGWKVGFIDSGAKAAQNDTWTVTNASTVIWGAFSIDSTGASETFTLSSNVITLTSATTGATSGLILYKE